MSHVAPISLLGLCLAASLLMINGAISVAFRLGLERTILRASVRMAVQLALVGLVLKLIFDAQSPWVTVLAALMMTAIASFEAVSRLERPFAGWSVHGLGAGTLLVTGLLGATFASAGVIGSQPWYQPRVMLPILGMVLGNTLTGISLVLDTMTDMASRERMAIEARLALGQPRLVALEPVLRRAMRTGLTPILNAMAVAGVVSLPGMMTGQILAGGEPLEAAKYQIMILFIIAGATGLAVTATAMGGLRLLTDERHRLRLDRLKLRSS